MLAPAQFIKHVIVPACLNIGAYTPAAERLLLGTALVESGLQYLEQIKGPALGLFQMEPATHDDIWENYIKYKPLLRDRVQLVITNSHKHKQLIHNLLYSATMARIHYLRVPEPLPNVEDLEGLAGYWKKYYNTHLGRGEVGHFVARAEPVWSAVYGVYV